MSSNRRTPRTRTHAATTPSSESLAQASADLETLWQRVMNSARLANGAPLPSERRGRWEFHGGTETLRRTAGSAARGRADSARREPAYPDSDSSDGGRTQNADGWTLVNSRPWDVSRPGRATPLLSPLPGPPRSRRRLDQRRAAWQPPSSRPDRHAADAAAEDLGPIAQGPVVLFDSDDVDDSIDADLPHPGDFDDWFVRTFRDNIIHQFTNPRALDARRHRAALATMPRSKGSGPPSSVIVRQAWNAPHAWRPYVYQPPGADTTRLPSADRQGILAGGTVDAARPCAVHSELAPLALRCTGGDDARGAFRHALTLNSMLFQTSRTRNVHVELAVGRGHCVVERILVVSSMASPPCSELMVFASSRRCDLAELRCYDNFTFAQYEQLAAKIARDGAPPGPRPIAYFWLSFEEEYEQMQVLPEGVACRYLYVKLLRGPDADSCMSLRLLRVFGWEGPRSFAEAAIC
ncbi:hypothetical protein LPJ63_000353 [Coemansia sp. RSA 2711]|nr:hypothetical protein LPJ63_000353 [Coemansia sp. RSA 2711]